MEINKKHLQNVEQNCLGCVIRESEFSQNIVKRAICESKLSKFFDLSFS